MSVENQINDTVKKGFNLFKEQYVALIIGTLIAMIGMILIITIPPLIFGIYYMCTQIVTGEKVDTVWFCISDEFDYLGLSPDWLINTNKIYDAGWLNEPIYWKS